MNPGNRIAAAITVPIAAGIMPRKMRGGRGLFFGEVLFFIQGSQEYQRRQFSNEPERLSINFRVGYRRTS